MKKLLKKVFNWLRGRRPMPEMEPLNIDTLAELKRFRDVEATIEQVCKMLKCQPDEMLTRLNKILAHIEELEAEKKRLEISK